MKEKRPILVSFIVDLNFLNAFLLIVSLFPTFVKQLGITTPTPNFPSIIIKVLAVLILLIISYGLLRLRIWGYWLMIAYNMFFLVVSVIFLLKLAEQSFYNQGFIVSVLGLTLTFPVKRYFIKESEST